MRLRLALPLLLCTALPASSEEEEPPPCPPYGAPSDLTLEYKDFSGGTGTDVWVQGSWDVAPYDFATIEWLGWYLERKDGGGEFQHHADVGVSDNETNGAFVNFVRNPPNACAASCLEKGGTYTFRVAAKWRWKPACPNYDGMTYTTSFTNEATITVPGAEPPPPEGDPPRDVLAVGDTKKPRVAVTWKHPAETEPDTYVIRRRTVTDPSKGAKDDAAFVEVGRVKGSATSFTDKKITPDSVYEYVVDAYLAGGKLDGSIVDRAFALAGRCPKSAFEVWDGDYDVYGAAPFRYALTVAARAGQNFHGSFTSVESDGRADPNGLGFEGLGEGDSDRWPSAGFKGALTRRGAFVDAWANGLGVGDTVICALAFVPSTPLNPAAYRELEGRLAAKPKGGKRVTYDFTAVRVTPVFDVGTAGRTARLCATASAGTSKAVSPGEDVVVVYQLLNLGPHPLFSRRAELEVTVGNGEIAEAVAPGDFYAISRDPAGLSVETFGIGAIGPVSPTKSQLATLVLRVRAHVPAEGTKAELSLGFRVLADKPAAPYYLDEDVETVGTARRIEVPIAVPAKR